MTVSTLRSRDSDFLRSDGGDDCFRGVIGGESERGGVVTGEIEAPTEAHSVDSGEVIALLVLGSQEVTFSEAGGSPVSYSRCEEGRPGEDSCVDIIDKGARMLKI